MLFEMKDGMPVEVNLDKAARDILDGIDFGDTDIEILPDDDDDEYPHEATSHEYREWISEESTFVDLCSLPPDEWQYW